MTDEHITGCTGNGGEPCWKCLGDGTYDAPIDDITDEEVICDECGGAGETPCPGCRADSEADR